MTYTAVMAANWLVTSAAGYFGIPRWMLISIGSVWVIIGCMVVAFILDTSIRKPRVDWKWPEQHKRKEEEDKYGC